MLDGFIKHINITFLFDFDIHQIQANTYQGKQETNVLTEHLSFGTEQIQATTYQGKHKAEAINRLPVEDNYFSSLIVIISTKAWYSWKLFFQVSENLIFFFLTSRYLPSPLHFSYALFSYFVAFFFSAPCQNSDLSPRRLRVQDDFFFKGKPYCYMSCGVVSIIRLKDGVKNDR